jgi:hypothetical protein
LIVNSGSRRSGLRAFRFGANMYARGQIFRSIAGFSLAACALLMSACSVLTPRPATPISEVVTLGKSSRPEQVIDRIGHSKTTYALRGSDFGKLADAGVAPPVLDYLQQAFVDDVDLLTRYWVLGESLGGCTSCYPQPVDLATLTSGGNGMADARGLGRVTSFSKPQGLPDWVSANPGSFNAPALTVEEIEQLVKQGTPGAGLAARIDASRLHDIIGTRGITQISTHHVAGLSGSQLAQLHQEGASDEVLDALQRKFLAEYIDFARIRYENLGKGSRTMK